MAVLVNFKICDNAKECGGIAVCPTGALSYDDEKKSIIIDNEKCISCGRCESECPIGAIMVARTDEEYAKMKDEIDNDNRTTKDLFVDRYGATPLSEFFMIESNDIENKVHNDGLTLIELYNDDSIQCLLKSIPIKELSKDLPKDTLFYKVEATENIINQYDIDELPSLLIFKKENLLGHVDGYYTIDSKEEIINKIKEIVN